MKWDRSISPIANSKAPAPEMTAFAPKLENVTVSTRRPEGGQRIRELDGLHGMAILTVMLLHRFYFAPGADYRAKDLIHHIYLFCERYVAGRVSYCLYLIHYGFLFLLNTLFAVTLKHVTSWEGILMDAASIRICYGVA
jgi:peptidoglycan/LPS O-acetylase OafA/YrhL